MSEPLGSILLREWHTNPARFSEEGRAYELLQEYFDGFSLETLRPFLSSSESLTRRDAVWIVSELGAEGRSLIDDVVPLLEDNDRFTTICALEVILVCSIEERVDRFSVMIPYMQSDDDAVRVRTMQLISNANPLQLQAGIRHFEAESDQLHQEGLSRLLQADLLEPEIVRAMLKSNDALRRKYGAMVAKRLFGTFPFLIAEATASEDKDISAFAREVLEMEDFMRGVADG